MNYRVLSAQLQRQKFNEEGMAERQRRNFVEMAMHECLWLRVSQSTQSLPTDNSLKDSSAQPSLGRQAQLGGVCFSGLV